jgi:hypothetical protein
MSACAEVIGHDPIDLGDVAFADPARALVNATTSVSPARR